MKLKNCVPWGRSKSEYVKIFSLSHNDLAKKIIGCGDGPSSFNSESCGNVTSFDPIYQFTREEIFQRINETHSIIKNEMSKSLSDFIWEEFKNVDDLCSKRLNTMNTFLEDYEQGRSEGRYIPGELPMLPFKDNEFDLALSSHFLFLYDLGDEFHLKSILEMLRVSKEVRIFPLVNLEGGKSSSLEYVRSELEKLGYSCEVQRCEYEFQKGANSMLVIHKLQP